MVGISITDEYFSVVAEHHFQSRMGEVDGGRVGFDKRLKQVDDFVVEGGLHAVQSDPSISVVLDNQVD